MLVSVRAAIKLRYLWVNDTSFILSKLFRVGVKRDPLFSRAKSYELKPIYDTLF